MVAVLFATGDHIPVIPLGDVNGNVNGVPEHIGPICMKSGVDVGFTTTVIWFILAQGCAIGSGVKVYNIVMVLLMAGDHMPLIPLLDVEGRVIAAPEHLGGI